MPTKTSAVPTLINPTAAVARALPWRARVRPMPISTKPISDNRFMPEISGFVSIPTRRFRCRLNHLVAQLPLAPPQPVEIVTQDLDHIVLVATGLARSVRRHQHVLHCPERRALGQRLFGGHIESGAGDAARGE